MIRHLFSRPEHNYHYKSWVADRVDLKTRIERLHMQISVFASVIPGNVTEYSSADTVSNANEGEPHYPAELYSSLPGTYLQPDHRLWLKCWAQSFCCFEFFNPRAVMSVKQGIL